MSLRTLDRYAPNRVHKVGEHAVVLGASIAGLLTARVLADAFDRVTILERDPMAATDGVRKGVPQARHVHALLVGGQLTIEDLLPGFADELVAAGGLSLDSMSEFSFHVAGAFIAPGPVRVPMCFASRPLIEHCLREKITTHGAVRLRGGCQAVGPVAREGDGPVTGVEVLVDGQREQVDADLVVDATGRATRMPSWHEQLGFPPPAVEEVEVDLAYATCQLKRPADDRRAVLAIPEPPRTRGGGIFPMEGDRWLVTLAGMHDDHPAPVLDELRAFATGLPTSVFSELLEHQPLASPDIAHYRFPTQRRHRYDELKTCPEGLLAVGDAVASFNPVYGQGMSVAALEALALHHALAEQGGGDGLARRFYARSSPIVEDAWNMAAGSDFKFPQTRGDKPAGTDLINRYVHRLHRKAHSDGRLTEAFGRVAAMEHRPTSLFRPQVAWRVLRPGHRADAREVHPS